MTLQTNRLSMEQSYGVALLDRLTKNELRSADDAFKPQTLKENFGVSLHMLHVLKANLHQRCSELQVKCRKDEHEFRVTMDRLRTRLMELQDQFAKLDTHVHVVSGRLTHLGDQLERKNLLRKRIEEARELILEFYKFLGAGGSTSSLTAVTSLGDGSQFLGAITRMKNLSSLCLELPDDERFLIAKQRVTVAHQELERKLLDRFRTSCNERDINMMKRIADVMSNLKSHMDCTGILIDEVVKGLDYKNLDLKAVTKRLVSAEKIIMAVFSRPETVLMQLITTVTNTLIKPHMDSRIQPQVNKEAYLINLYTEYKNMDKLIKQLSDELTLITDPAQLSKLFRELFTGYLTDYMNQEKQLLARHLNRHLVQFYESRGHSKRNLGTSGLSELKRDFKAKFHIQPGERDLNDYEESLLSEEVAVNIIEEIRRAAERCLLLSQPSEFAANGMTLFSYLQQYLIADHVDYGITLAMHGLQATDPRYVSPNVVFFSIAHDATSIVQFFGRTIDQSIVPLVSASAVMSQDLTTKRQVIQQDLETKLQQGLDRCIGLCVSHVQHLLASEQRKTDFRPDTNSPESIPNLSGTRSRACECVLSFLKNVLGCAQKNLDGQNLKNVFAELGIRVNRTLIDHFYGFTFSDSGGFVAMQDVTAYREVAKKFENPVVDHLYDVLLKLMNLMLIKPENVRQVTQDYLQSGIPRDLLQNFIQLRADYKTAKFHLDVRA